MTDIFGPSLKDFTAAVADASDNAKVKISDSGLVTTRLPVWASTQARAMNAFIDAIEREFGSDAAEQIGDSVRGRRLTARVVRDALDKLAPAAHSKMCEEARAAYERETDHPQRKLNPDIKFNPFIKMENFMEVDSKDPLAVGAWELMKELGMRDVERLRYRSGIEGLDQIDLKKELSDLMEAFNEELDFSQFKNQDGTYKVKSFAPYIKERSKLYQSLLSMKEIPAAGLLTAEEKINIYRLFKHEGTLLIDDISNEELAYAIQFYVVAKTYSNSPLINDPLENIKSRLISASFAYTPFKGQTYTDSRGLVSFGAQRFGDHRFIDLYQSYTHDLLEEKYHLDDEHKFMILHLPFDKVSCLGS